MVRRLLSLLVLAPVLLAGCDAPAKASDVDPETGIGRDALVGVGGIGDGATNLYGVFYKRDRADQAQLKAAPARLCAARHSTLVSAKDIPLEHADTMPGVSKLMVRCT